MSENGSQLDISQLAVERRPASAPAKSVRRAWITRYVLPASIFLGFLSVFGWAARDSFLPATSVTITPVIVSRMEVRQEGAPLFQAAGWVEPRPTPVVASALAAGVIQELYVIEGQAVEQGEPIAKLIDADSELALQSARSQFALQAAEVRRAEAALRAAETHFAKPVQSQSAFADAEVELAKTRTELERLPFALEAAKIRRHLAEDNVSKKEHARDAISGRILREARAELLSAINAVHEIESRAPILKSRLNALQQKRDALAESLSLLTEETRALAEANANLAIAKARSDHAQSLVDMAALRLHRMKVLAPITGRILRVTARPGQWVAGVGESASPENGNGSAIAELYDPKSLQVRVDVRLENVPQVRLGQPVAIETASHAEPLDGQVTSVTTRADIQKNTLQVKVSIDNPPELVRPEMLAKVTFLAPPSPPSDESGVDSPLRIFVPEPLVTTGESGASVWVADLTQNMARRKNVEVGAGAETGGLVEITRGLTPTDKLIVSGRESIVDGARIRVAREERAAPLRESVAAARTASNTDLSGSN